MELHTHLQQMADYNQWSNQNLLHACAPLTDGQLTEDQGAFFKSTLGTFNHLMVADLIWLRRFARCPALSPNSQQQLAALNGFPEASRLDQSLYEDITSLSPKRIQLDQIIGHWIASLDNAVLDYPLQYRNSRGIASTRILGLLLCHFFNHQTHHRGQLGTLLHQQGIDPGVTDLLVRIPEVTL